jgi:hypothetical protein
VRSDMAKLLTEPGQCGGWSANNGALKPFRKTEPEDWWSKERIKDRWHGGSKYPEVRLGPLRRYLRSRVGHPWDQVYSEICQDLRGTSGARQRLMTHVDRYVERTVILVDGVPCHGAGFNSESPLRNHAGWYFYVCPTSGLLKSVPQRRASRP